MTRGALVRANNNSKSFHEDPALDPEAWHKRKSMGGCEDVRQVVRVRWRLSLPSAMGREVRLSKLLPSKVVSDSCLWGVEAVCTSTQCVTGKEGKGMRINANTVQRTYLILFLSFETKV